MACFLPRECFLQHERHASRANPSAFGGRASSDYIMKTTSKTSSEQQHYRRSSRDLLDESRERGVRLLSYLKKSPKLESSAQFSQIDFESLPPAVRRKVSLLNSPELPN